MKFHLQMLTLQLEKLQRNSPTRLLCRFRRGSFWNEWRVANRNGSRCCQCEKIEKKPRSPVRYMGCKNTDNKLFTFSKSYREEEVTLRCVWRSGDHTTIFATLYNYYFNFFLLQVGPVVYEDRNEIIQKSHAVYRYARVFGYRVKYNIFVSHGVQFPLIKRQV